jgi:catechol 2,3-dioxygenase-like lactoylglutathione lyase family enzyme
MGKVSMRYIVNDVDAAVRFYTGHLGFQPRMRPAPGFAALDRGDVRLLLNAPGAGGAGQAMPDATRPEPGGWNRLQLEVEDLAATVRRLKEQGAGFRNDIVEGQGGRQILIEDPSHNVVELFEPRARDGGERAGQGAGEAPAPPAPGPEHRKLEILVGTWNTRGTIKDSPAGPGGRLEAVDSYEWMPGGFFLLHDVDGHMGTAVVKATEIIAYDRERQGYSTWSFDNQGNASTYRANLQGLLWTIQGDSERFSGAFSKDGRSLTGTWERWNGGAAEWRPWMEVKLTKE